MITPAAKIRVHTIASEKNIEEALSMLLPVSEPDVEAAVREIIEKVVTEGDAALAGFAARFDGVNKEKYTVRVGPKEFAQARKQIDPEFKKAFKAALINIRTFHSRKTQKDCECSTVKRPGVKIERRIVPIECAGIYVPGGRHPLPSSVLMTAVPAQAAGVKKIIGCTPPRSDGTANPHILYAFSELGIKDVFKAGGAQAAAAMTFGTSTIPQVDMIAGPGNIYFTTAKRLLYGHVGIDMPAGPSEALIYCSAAARLKEVEAEAVAWNLLSQAEHGGDSTAVFLSARFGNAEAVALQIHKIVQGSSRLPSWITNRVFFMHSKTETLARSFINRFAPEHLQVIGAKDSFIAGLVNAGVIFKGLWTPVAAGDFTAGPSHVLPTAGGARYACALSAAHFTRVQSVVTYTKAALRKEAPFIAAFCDVEGLPCHKKSAQI